MPGGFSQEICVSAPLPPPSFFFFKCLDPPLSRVDTTGSSWTSSHTNVGKDHTGSRYESLCKGYLSAWAGVFLVGQAPSEQLK